MEAVKKANAGKTEKMSYEQLENVAHQLSEQNKQMYSQLQQMDMVNLFKRLDYLFKVLEYQNSFNKEFTDTCVKEIMTMMTIPDKNEEAQ